MDWQQPLALLIVAATAGAFLWSKVRARSGKVLPFAQHGHCGCSTAPIGPRQSVTFRARKGKRPEVLVRNE